MTQAQSQSVLVCARFKPLSEAEKAKEASLQILQSHLASELWTFSDEKKGVRLSVPLPGGGLTSRSLDGGGGGLGTDKDKKTSDWTLDRVFPFFDCNTRDVFESVGKPIVTGFLDGYNGTVMAYGQTNSGKTYSMFGPDPGMMDRKSPSVGIISLSSLQILETLQVREREASENGKKFTWTLSLAMLEVYNESVRDLLEGVDPGEIAAILPESDEIPEQEHPQAQDELQCSPEQLRAEATETATTELVDPEDPIPGPVSVSREKKEKDKEKEKEKEKASVAIPAVVPQSKFQPRRFPRSKSASALPESGREAEPDEDDEDGVENNDGEEEQPLEPTTAQTRGGSTSLKKSPTGLGSLPRSTTLDAEEYKKQRKLQEQRHEALAKSRSMTPTRFQKSKRLERERETTTSTLTSGSRSKTPTPAGTLRTRKTGTASPTPHSTSRSRSPDTRGVVPSSRTRSRSGSSGAASKGLEVVVDKTGNGFQVSGLSNIPVTNVHQVATLIKYGQNQRVVGFSVLNQQSSRSHSMVRFFLRTETRDESDTEDGESLLAELNMVDLAGSEALETGARATETNAKESKNINLSLTTLTSVIRSLTESSSHIPYRNSKLTKILANSLGGNAQTALIGTLSPVFEQLGPSKKTLDFLKTAKKIKNSPFKRKTKIKAGFSTLEREEAVTKVLTHLKGQKAGMEQLTKTLEEQSLAYNACKAEKMNLEQHVTDMIATSQKLSEELAKFQGTSDKQSALIDNLQTSIASLQSSLEEKEKERALLAEKLELLTREKEAGSEELLSQLSFAEGELRKHKIKLENMEEQVISGNRSLQIVHAQRESDRQAAEARLTASDAKMTQLLQDLKSSQRDAQLLSEDMAQVKQALDAVKHALEEKEAEINRYSSIQATEVSVSARLKEQLEREQAAREVLVTRLDEQTTQHKAQEASFELRLKTQTDQRKAELDTLASIAEQQRAEKATREVRLQELETQLASANSRILDLNKSSMEHWQKLIQSSESSQKQKDEDILLLQRSSNLQEEKMQQILKDVKNLSLERDALLTKMELQLGEHNKTAAYQGFLLEKERAEHQNLKQKCSELLASLETAQSQVTEIKRENLVLEATKREGEALSTELKVQLESTNATTSQLTGRTTALEDELRTRDREITALKLQVGGAAGTASEMSTRIVTVEKELQKRESDLVDLKAQLDTADATAHSLTTKTSTLEAKLKEKEDKLVDLEVKLGREKDATLLVTTKIASLEAQLKEKDCQLATFEQGILGKQKELNSHSLSQAELHDKIRSTYASLFPEPLVGSLPLVLGPGIETQGIGLPALVTGDGSGTSSSAHLPLHLVLSSLEEKVTQNRTQATKDIVEARSKAIHFGSLVEELKQKFGAAEKKFESTIAELRSELHIREVALKKQLEETEVEIKRRGSLVLADAIKVITQKLTEFKPLLLSELSKVLQVVVEQTLLPTLESLVAELFQKMDIKVAIGSIDSLSGFSLNTIAVFVANIVGALVSAALTSTSRPKMQQMSLKSVNSSDNPKGKHGGSSILEEEEEEQRGLQDGKRKHEVEVARLLAESLELKATNAKWKTIAFRFLALLAVQAFRSGVITAKSKLQADSEHERQWERDSDQDEDDILLEGGHLGSTTVSLERERQFSSGTRRQVASADKKGTETRRIRRQSISPLVLESSSASLEPGFGAVGKKTLTSSSVIRTRPPSEEGEEQEPEGQVGEAVRASVIVHPLQRSFTQTMYAQGTERTSLSASAPTSRKPSFHRLGPGALREDPHSRASAIRHHAKNLPLRTASPVFLGVDKKLTQKSKSKSTGQWHSMQLGRGFHTFPLRRKDYRTLGRTPDELDSTSDLGEDDNDEDLHSDHHPSPHILNFDWELGEGDGDER